MVIVIYPHFQAPALYIHNYYNIYTGLLLISLLLHVHASGVARIQRKGCPWPRKFLTGNHTH